MFNLADPLPHAVGGPEGAGVALPVARRRPRRAGAHDRGLGRSVRGKGQDAGGPVPSSSAQSAKHPDNEPFARELALLRFKQRRDCPGALESLARFESTTSDTDTLNALGTLPDLSRPASGGDRALRALSGVEAGSTRGRPVPEPRAARRLESERQSQERIDQMKERKSAVVLFVCLDARTLGLAPAKAKPKRAGGPPRLRLRPPGAGLAKQVAELRRPLPSVGPRHEGQGRTVAPEASGFLGVARRPDRPVPRP